MKIVLVVAVVTLLLSLPAEGRLRKTSLENELKILKKLFQKALEEMKRIKESVDSLCPTCADKCADDCLDKQLWEFEERLKRLYKVICTLEKLACKECPGYFWAKDKTADDTKTMSTSTSLASSASVRRLEYYKAPVKHLVVGAGGNVFVEGGGNFGVSNPVLGVTYDKVTEHLFSLETLPSGSVLTMRNYSTGAKIKTVNTYPAGSLQPVDVTVDTDGTLYLLLTNGTTTTLEKISNPNGANPPVVDPIASVTGEGRRLAIGFNGNIYFTADNGIYRYQGASIMTLSSDPNAVGISFDFIGLRAIICYSDSSDMGIIDDTITSLPVTIDTRPTAGPTGCSDLNVHHYDPNKVFTPSTRDEHVEVYVAANDQNKIVRYLLSSPATVTNKMDGVFTAQDPTSIALIC